MAAGTARDRFGNVHPAGSPASAGESATLSVMVFGKKTKTAKTAAPAKPARARRASKPKPPAAPVVEAPPALPEDEFAEHLGRMIYPDHDEEW